MGPSLLIYNKVVNGVKVRMLTEKMKLILEDVKKGIPVLVCDDRHREDETDIVIALEKCDEKNIAWSMLHARGLMCVSMTGELVEKLKIPPMPNNNRDALSTPFQCPVDATDAGTGMSCSNRLKTFDAILNEQSERLLWPGHIQILKCRDGKLKERKGHTESSVELMLLAGLKPLAMIQEVILDDGEMLSGNQVNQFAGLHGLKIVTVEEIYEAVYGSK